MKRIVLTILAALLISVAGAQNIFEELAENYADNEGFSAVQLTSDMFELYLKKKNIEEDDPVFETLNNLENIMVISQTFTRSDEENPGEALKYEIIEHYKNNDYSLFKTEKGPGSDLKIYIQKDGSGIESLGLISSNSFSVNLIEMNGDIDLANISNLNRALNIRGLEQLSVFDNNSPNQFFFNYSFPRPGEWSLPNFNGSNRFVDLSELSEEKKKEYQEQLQEHQEKLHEHQALIEEQFHSQMEQQERMRERSRELYKKYNKYPIILQSEKKDAEYFINDKKVDFEEIKKIDPKDIHTTVVLNASEDRSNVQIKIWLKNFSKKKKN